MVRPLEGLLQDCGKKLESSTLGRQAASSRVDAKPGRESRSAMRQLILGEPFRAIFYSPYYVAEALDAFGRQGVEVQMVTAGSADLAAQNLLDGAADVAWSGADAADARTQPQSR
jgi:hypothetical protein